MWAALLVFTLSMQALPPEQQPTTDPCASMFKPDLISCFKDRRDSAFAQLELYLAEVRRHLTAAPDAPSIAGQPSALESLNAGQRAWQAFVEADCDAIYWYWGMGEREVQLLGCQALHAESRTYELWSIYLSHSTTKLPEPEDPCRP